MNSPPPPAPPPPEADPALATEPRSPWARFVRAHLHDYAPRALAVWLALVACGACAGLWAALQVWNLPSRHGLVVLAMAAAALASLFPVRIPRTKFALSTSDLCVFMTLAWLGPAAAVLAAGADAASGAWRTSRRLSSRWATPAAAMAAAALAGAAYQVAHPLVQPALGEAGATVAALGLAALVIFVGTTLPLMSMMSLKQGRRISLRDWFTSCAWVAATMQGAALLAGLVVLNARLFGSGLLVAAASLTGALVWLLRVTLARQEAEQAAQEAQLASARREAEINQQRFMAAFSHAAVGMAIVGSGELTLRANRALAQLLGFDEAELVGQPFRQFLHAADVPLLERPLRELAERPEQAVAVELRCQHQNGEQIWVTLHCSRFEDPGAGGRCVIYQLHDITSRHLAEQRLQHIAYHDNLTDLPNRACFTDRLSLAIERRRVAGDDTRFAVLYLDLDRFKVVNDSLGHQAGNELLCRVADRLRESVRPQDLVARLGGDEFVVLCEGISDLAQARQVAQRVSEVLSRPLAICGTEVVPGVSIGITISEGPADHGGTVTSPTLGPRSVEEILRDADLAMYEAKSGGRGRVAVFDVTMHHRIADRLALEADLRHAVGAGKLSAAFQPIFTIQGRRLAGLEVLARWEHPVRGWVPPGVFIQLAEEAGHIGAVTRWIIEHSIEQLAAWRREGLAQEGVTMHVNVSGRDLADPALVSHVQATLGRHEVPANLLSLEITETTLMNKLEESMASLNALRALGVRFSIDDFGTGYSSLAYLSTLPFDSLKIDRSFVNGMASGQKNIEIVRTVLQLGHTLGKVVVAEGIETAEQLQELQRMGVDYGQGYLLSRPLAPMAMRELLQTVAIEPMGEPGAMRHDGLVVALPTPAQPGPAHSALAHSAVGTMSAAVVD